MLEITQILAQVEQGDPHAGEKLLPLIYDDLRRLAAAKLAQEKPGQTLQATALVHEAYVRLMGSQEPEEGDQESAENRRQSDRWQGHAHFFAAAAEAMRRILIDQARRKQSVKHGGGQSRVEFSDFDPISPSQEFPCEDLLALDEALTQLETQHPEKARLVKLRYFAGLTLDDACAALSISPATGKRHWVFARAWLYGRLQGQAS